MLHHRKQVLNLNSWAHCRYIYEDLYLLPVQKTHPQQMLVFEKVWGRSFCRTIEKLVEVVQEYPSEVEHIYSPSCVPLVRCAGCCGDENLECHPTQTTNVTICERFMRLPSEQGQEYVEMTFVEHQTCECSFFFYNLVLGSGKGEEEGRGRRDKKRRNVTGEGHTGGRKRSHIHHFILLQLLTEATLSLVFYRCQIPRR
uniref:Placental growth factor b n=1 Tax=Maylandia zebra TaxID=106582 RepID=A0A3P9D022_9CICH